MRPSDFFVEPKTALDDESAFALLPATRHLNAEIIVQLRRGPIEDNADIEVAVALARLVHDELERFGTGGGEELSEEEMREALLALHAVVRRLGIDGFQVPFRDYGTFKSWWLKNDGYGSWQARRDLLAGIFDSLHDRLADMEDRALASSLSEAISPHARTGWSAVDTEIGELRRHFERASSPQDYRAVGLGCVAVIEALSAQVYDPDRHLRQGETEPPIARTKQRIGRFVEDTAAGSDNDDLRTLARSAIEFAQHVKHRTTPTRREAGIAADTVILLANILRRLDEPE